MVTTIIIKINKWQIPDLLNKSGILLFTNDLMLNQNCTETVPTTLKGSPGITPRRS